MLQAFGLYPLVGIVSTTECGNGKGRRVRIKTCKGDNIFVSPASINSSYTQLDSCDTTVVAFEEVTRGAKWLGRRSPCCCQQARWKATILLANGSLANGLRNLLHICRGQLHMMSCTLGAFSLPLPKQILCGKRKYNEDWAHVSLYRHDFLLLSAREVILTKAMQGKVAL
jgi:hypothetical protein